MREREKDNYAVHFVSFFVDDERKRERERGGGGA